MFIYLLLVGSLFLELFLFKNVYPDYFESTYNFGIVQYHKLQLMIKKTSINVAYNSIYVYSLCQIQAIKLYAVFSNILGIVDTNRTFILLDKFGNQLFDVNVPVNTENIPINLSLIQQACEQHKGETETVLMVDKQKGFQWSNCVFYPTFPETLEYKASTINFLSIELEVGSNVHKLSLKDDTHNYYIVGNVLNQLFFKYYLKNRLNLSFDEDNFDYKLHIIDHNVNFITCLPYQSITLNENGYIIEPKPPDLSISNILDNNANTDDNTNVDVDVDVEVDNDMMDNYDDYIELDSTSLLYA